MLHPSIDLLTEVENKYYLVNMAAIRARQLQNGAKRISKVETTKNVAVAINEIFDKQVTFSHTKPTGKGQKL